jgi:hypothetical protein
MIRISSPGRVKNFPFFTLSRLDLDLHRVLSNGYQEIISPVVKRPGREADYSTPASVEMKKIKLICLKEFKSFNLLS